MDKQIIVYEPNEQVKMEVKTDGETVWLTIDQMSALFGRDSSVIGKHIKAAFSEEELDDSINRQNLPINGRGRPLSIYDLDVVISVGYRVKSIEGVRFRKWATRALRNMLLQRLSDMRRIDKLESRMDKAEIDIKQIKGGFNTSGESENIDIYASKKAGALKAYCAKHKLRGAFVCKDESEDELFAFENGFSEDIDDPGWKPIDTLFSNR